MTLTWTDDDLARETGYSKAWIQKNRKALEADGFPKKDPLLNRYIAADVLAWFDNRRKVRTESIYSGSLELPNLDQA